MDDAGRLLERLRRLEALRLIDERCGDGGGPPGAQLSELRALCPHAEAWAWLECDLRGQAERTADAGRWQGRFAAGRRSETGLPPARVATTTFSSARRRPLDC